MSLIRGVIFCLFFSACFGKICMAQASTTATLPVMFDNVRIYLVDQKVKITWSNLTERELVNYVVERSTDAINYVPLRVFLPLSNQNEPMHYSDTDPDPAPGLNYYRIKVNEISGKVILSKVLKIETRGSTNETFTLYPNPVSAGQLNWNISGLAQGGYSLTIVSESGVPVYREQLQLDGNAAAGVINLPASLSPGYYLLLLSNDRYKSSRKFLVL